jgi:H+/Cl- antiporter ClcA
MKILKSPYILIGILLGAAGGFAYWNFVGCLDGTCMITSKWPNSTAYGAVMGALVGDLVRGLANSYLGKGKAKQ